MISKHGYTKYVHDRCRCDICIEANSKRNENKKIGALPKFPMVCPFCNVRYRDHPLRSCMKEVVNG